MAKDLLGDEGYACDRLRQFLTARGIAPSIPSSGNRKVLISYDKAFSRQRHRIENMSDLLEGQRRTAMRYDQCAHTSLARHPPRQHRPPQDQ